MKKYNGQEIADNQSDMALSLEELEQLSPESREAFSVLDQICTSKSEEETEAILESYLASVQGDPIQKQISFDAQASLEKFRSQHKVLMESPPTAVPRSRKLRLRKRVIIVAAATFLLASCVVTASGKTPYELLASWGLDTFRLESDSPPVEIGDKIYFSDGTCWDRSGLLTSEEGDEIVRYIEDNNLTPEEAKEYILKLMEEGTYDKEPPAEPEGELLEPLDVPSPVTTIQEEGTIFEVMEKYGVDKKIFPTWIPEGFVQTDINVVTDSRYNTIDFNVTYEKGVCSLGFSTMRLLPGSEGSIIEKDSRPVEKYTSGGVEYYLMYNLSQVDAVTIVDNTEIFFNGDVTKDEMKKMIDSIYEGADS